MKPAGVSMSKAFAALLPSSWQPYIQLTRLYLFAGSLLIFWPYAWSLGLIARRVDLGRKKCGTDLLAWLVCSILLHSVGSTWNDICDIDIDRQVERTKTRPLPSGRVSIKGALLWLSPQVITLSWLFSSFGYESLYMGVIQLFILTSIYPFMKRLTYFPQVWLGVTLGWGAIMSWVAVADADWHILSMLLFAFTVWITYCDTFYAMLDKRDDPQAGVKSTALLFGENARLILSTLALIFVVTLARIGWISDQGLWFYLLSVGGAVGHMAWQLYTVEFDDPVSCLSRFKSNPEQLGSIIFIGIMADYMF